MIPIKALLAGIILVSISNAYSETISMGSYREFLLANSHRSVPKNKECGKGISYVCYKVTYHSPAYDRLVYPKINEVPLVRIIESDDISLDDILALISMATGYEIKLHKTVNTGTLVSIRSDSFPLTTIGAYLENVTDVNIAIYPEVKMLVVTPNSHTMWGERRG